MDEFDAIEFDFELDILGIERAKKWFKGVIYRIKNMFNKRQMT